MFTGIVQATGSIASLEARGGDVRIGVDAGALAARVSPERLALGESIAVNGACLTVVAFDGRVFLADVSRETLALTTLSDIEVGQCVNLEAALRLGDPLGGHLVSGHVDGVATVVALTTEARSLRVQIEAPASLARYIAPKGSVTLDGVSLTVNEVDGCRFGVNLIPHTVEATNFDTLAPGKRLNLEVDPIARYVERLMNAPAG